ncbi:winged helix DNA-binding domain-containing protein [Nocardioides humilatus]|uniref:Winged helix DNA-binding domain-containing protein n=1 Tax=Nocardioides humilatus TaxID=2607660 RepID=A0A5B1LBV0_9ACTN|nr:winged helix DNA-binding domain-containing protein [Nocardioides humilatus]KAA1417754.1 winged helix DNA-binding domain-containing protein [Nocardioides humilatus]
MPLRLTRLALNRTLLLRQHLLARAAMPPEEMVEHLIGLQAQENLPPYLSLAARLTDFDPREVSKQIEARALVRLLTMRGTIHLLTPDDAAVLRTWVTPRIEQEVRVSQAIDTAREIDRPSVEAALEEVLASGPLPQKDIGLQLAERFPYPATQLGQLARCAAPLAQLPPRGCWKASGGVVYDYVDRWTGVPMREPDVPALVRRYLRAFGPATAADVTAWSAVTGLAPVLKAMDDLVRHEDEDGKVLFDLADAPIADDDTPAPVRLLGTYDNVWLSHARRDRVTDPEARKSWMGTNGGVGNTVFVDGWLTGIWRVVDDKVVVDRLQRELTPTERDGLAEEIERVEGLLATPA